MSTIEMEREKKNAESHCLEESQDGWPRLVPHFGKMTERHPVQDVVDPSSRRRKMTWV